MVKFTEKPERIVRRYDSGQIELESYCCSNSLHRADGPARIWYYKNGAKKRVEYWFHGHTHRPDAPAVILYFPSGKLRFEMYAVDGKLHRDDGPAFIAYDGVTREEYWWKSHLIEMNDHVNLMKKSSDKTKTLIHIMNESKDLRKFKILANMFRGEIEKAVVDNLEMFS